MRKPLAKLINALDVFAVIVITGMASVFQFALHEPPCPLCLLQRLGMLFISLGFLMNLRFTIKPSHYAISLLGAVFTAMVAMRQVLLHIVPGSGSYGAPLFGLHLYTWVFLIAVGFIVWTSIMLLADSQFEPVTHTHHQLYGTLVCLLFILILCIALLNGFTTFAECGFNFCPANPTNYR